MWLWLLARPATRITLFPSPFSTLPLYLYICWGKTPAWFSLLTFAPSHIFISHIAWYNRMLVTTLNERPLATCILSVHESLTIDLFLSLYHKNNISEISFGPRTASLYNIKRLNVEKRRKRTLRRRRPPTEQHRSAPSSWPTNPDVCLVPLLDFLWPGHLLPTVSSTPSRTALLHYMSAGCCLSAKSHIMCADTFVGHERVDRCPQTLPTQSPKHGIILLQWGVITWPVWSGKWGTPLQFPLNLHFCSQTTRGNVHAFFLNALNKLCQAN